jgi:hypothetical protein
MVAIGSRELTLLATSGRPSGGSSGRPDRLVVRRERIPSVLRSHDHLCNREAHHEIRTDQECEEIE